MSASQHWANMSEAGSFTGMRLLLAAYQIGGQPLFRFFLFPTICFYFFCRPKARHAIRDFHVRAAKMNNTPIRNLGRTSFSNFWKFGLSTLDKLDVWMGNISRQDVEVHDGDIIDDIIASKQGAFVVSAHLGNFEICQSLSRTRPGMKLTVLQHTKHAENFNQLLKKYSGDSSIDLLQVSDLGIGDAIRMSEKIEQGNCIAVSADRVPVENPEATFPVDFMGKTAYFPKGPFALAVALDVPMIFIVCLKQEGKYHIYFERLQQDNLEGRRNKGARIQALVQAFAKRLEYYSLKEPEQWFNFYDFWAEADANLDKQEGIQ